MGLLTSVLAIWVGAGAPAVQPSGPPPLPPEHSAASPSDSTAAAQPTAAQSTAEQPAAEQPAADNTAAEQPAAAQPAAAQPPGEQPQAAPRGVGAPAQPDTAVAPPPARATALRDPFVAPSRQSGASVLPRGSVIVAQLDLQDPFRHGRRGARPVGEIPLPRTGLDLHNPFLKGGVRWDPCPPRATAGGVPLQRPTGVAPSRRHCNPEPGPLRDPFAVPVREPAPVRSTARSV